VIVAALLGWHEHHAAAQRALEAAMEGGTIVVPVPALVEAYAVMTRLPAPHRLRPADAHALLSGNFAGAAQVNGLSGEECWAMLEKLAGQGVAGGRTYDAHILAAAVKGRATAVLTLNVEDFEDVAPGGFEVLNPLEPP
jgi:predicted nucleic acid-binding protein